MILPRNLSKSLFSKPGFASWLLVVALSILIYLKFASALFFALTLAVVCRPLYERLCRVLGHFKVLASRPNRVRHLAAISTQFLASFSLFVCILAPLWVLTQNRKIIVTSAENAYTQAREWSRGEVQSLGQRLQIQEWNDFDDLPEPNESAGDPPQGPIQEQPVQDQVVEMISHPAPFVPYALKTLGGGLIILGQIMVFFMVLHFLLLHGPHFWREVLERCPPNWRPTLASLSERARTDLMATCLVHGLSAVSAFLLALPVFLLIFGMKHFVLLAMFAGFFQFIPLLGSATLVSLITLYFFAIGSFVHAWECVTLAFPLIVGVPDLVVRPYLSRKYGKMHSLIMLTGFITGIEVFGPLGFIVGPLFLDLIVQFTNQVVHQQKETAPRESTGSTIGSEPVVVMARSDAAPPTE